MKEKNQISLVAVERERERELYFSEIRNSFIKYAIKRDSEENL